MGVNRNSLSRYWLLLKVFIVIVISIWVCRINPSIEPHYYRYKDEPPILKGVLSPNEKLHLVKKLHEGLIIGPESFAVINGSLITGTADGKVWKIDPDNDNLELLTHVRLNSTKCGSYEYEPKCGRAKGMKVNPRDGYLYYLDAYSGLYTYNLRTREKEHLSSESNGTPYRFVNSLDIDKDGVVYFTDTSSKWQRRDYAYEVMEMNKLGRLLEYDPRTRTTRTLRHSLRMANGLTLSRDQGSLYVVEMNACRIMKHYLKGPKAGESETWIDNLPGYPDNIKPTSHGTYYVGLASSRFQGSSLIGSFLDFTGPYPWMKQIVAKITPYSLYKIFLPKHAILVEIDEKGQIVTSFHDPSGEVIMNGMSEAFEHDGYVYIGHFSAPYLGKIDKHLLYD